MAELPVGRAARGKAGVFGSSINPLSLYLQYSGQRERNKAAAAAQQRAERDKAMDYLDQYNPKSKFNEINYRTADMVQTKLRDPYIAGLQSGQSPLMLKNQAARVRGEIDAYIEETNAWKEKIDGLENDIKADPIRYKTGEGSALSAVRDIYKNPDGTLRSDDEIRESLLNADALKFDPRILNTEGVVKSFVEKLPEQNKVLLSKAYESIGYSPAQIEDIVKSGLTYEMEKNPVTGQMQVAMNEDLTPKVVVDDKLYRMAKADPYMNSLMMDASSSKDGQMEWLRQNVKGAGDKVLFDRQRSPGQNISDSNQRYYIFGKGGYGYRFPEADLKDRDDILDRAVLGQGDDVLSYFGQATKDVKASYGKDKEGKFIQVSYPSTNPEFEAKPQEEVDKMSEVEQSAYYASRYATKQIKTSKYYINNADQQRAAKIALSQRMDEIDKKRSLGEDYIRYVDDKRKSRKKLAADDL